MKREQLGDLSVFVVVAQELNFTRAAARLAVTQSSLSHAIRRLEAGLGLRLLTRTTRSVALTDAGQRLLQTVQPALGRIDAEIEQLAADNARPGGVFRITVAEHAADTVLMPALVHYLPANPLVQVEVVMDYGLADIVAQRIDAGIRLGEHLAKDMISVCVGPPLRMAVVASPGYFAAHAPPESPQDLALHRCINLRLPTSGVVYAWEFEHAGQEIRLPVGGPLIFNNLTLRLKAARAGLGVAFVPEDAVAEDLATGRLVRVLEAWCTPFPGYHLYYPHRRQSNPAFAALVDALRWKGA